MRCRMRRIENSIYHIRVWGMRFCGFKKCYFVAKREMTINKRVFCETKNSKLNLPYYFCGKLKHSAIIAIPFEVPSLVAPASTNS